MPECVMLVALAKITTGKRCDFSWPLMRLSKKQKKNLTKQCFLTSPFRFSTQSSFIQMSKDSFAKYYQNNKERQCIK